MLTRGQPRTCALVPRSESGYAQRPSPSFPYTQIVDGAEWRLSGIEVESGDRRKHACVASMRMYNGRQVHTLRWIELVPVPNISVLFASPTAPLPTLFHLPCGTTSMKRSAATERRTAPVSNQCSPFATYPYACGCGGGVGCRGWECSLCKSLPTCSALVVVILSLSVCVCALLYYSASCFLCSALLTFHVQTVRTYHVHLSRVSMISSFFFPCVRVCVCVCRCYIFICFLFFIFAVAFFFCCSFIRFARSCPRVLQPPPPPSPAPCCCGHHYSLRSVGQRFSRKTRQNLQRDRDRRTPCERQ